MSATYIHPSATLELEAATLPSHMMVVILAIFSLHLWHGGHPDYGRVAVSGGLAPGLRGSEEGVILAAPATMMKPWGRPRGFAWSGGELIRLVHLANLLA
jgi:hypothetical protein